MKLPKSNDFMELSFMTEPVNSGMMHIDFLFLRFPSGLFYDFLSISVHVAPNDEIKIYYLLGYKSLESQATFRRNMQSSTRHLLSR
jgi:hypothetical protein